uniref:Myb-like domain-containing protein n=1 Tax=Kalanchoe fedtschenkoi TaxID=63787 RepID=A0A7N0TT36_KALFE
MDDNEDDVRYNSNAAGGDRQDQEGYDREKGAEQVGSYERLNNEYGENEGEDDEEAAEELVEDEEEEEDDDDDDEDGDGVQRIGNNVVNDGDEEDGDEGVEEKRNEYKRRIEEIDFEKHPKKRRLKNLISNYEFAPRAVTQAQPSAVTANVVAASAPPVPAPKHSSGGRNALADWTEHETFVLLDAWGDRFLQHGRKSLRSEEWQEVAEKVSQESKIERTDTQCRNRVDTLKKKYKKEKAKFGAAGGQSSKWIYFKKMDVLMSPPPKQPGLSCGVDSGEYVFSNPRVYLNRANGLDEMRDSPGHSDSTEDDTYDSDGLPPRRKKPVRVNNTNSNSNSRNYCSPMKLLADSLHNFSKIYEKIESNKRQQMVELEKMRMDFHRDLEQEKKLILERAQAKIAKIWKGNDDENGASAENMSS